MYKKKKCTEMDEYDKNTKIKSLCELVVEFCTPGIMA